MRVALVNPRWSFEHSIYFGCREAHLPLELGYAQAMLRACGHDVLLLDGQFDRLDNEGLAEAIAEAAVDMTVVTTAPTYLFWRCAQPELRTPRHLLDALDGRGGRTVAVGPHGSVTPAPALAKLGADIVVRGECETVVAALADAGADPRRVDGTAWLDDGRLHTRGLPAAAAFVDQSALLWPDHWLARHDHHHHRFDARPPAPGAEVEASRGCPYSCTFCAKLDYRDAYRRRDLPPLLEEIDRLIGQGVDYLYFIDEIFLPQKPLLEALVPRDVRFGIQTRIDLWPEPMLELLGRAGCVSIEAGVESLTGEGRAALDKKCRMSTDALALRLVFARRHVPFVQANLIATAGDDPELVAAWRERLRAEGVWANDPVPLFCYPSSPDYRRRWGEPDADAWERAHDHYLEEFARFSDIQDQRPARLRELEAPCRPV
ncbi:MAG: TIGR04295 family B12-binding domain-containing radical SAM protein [Geminicoccaceae bacterium]|nr:TIGR04295 family B12-binding domain-containing radical SAM protein [Geminicoccaceae bacterium]